jgi:hypothetical protein
MLATSIAVTSCQKNNTPTADPTQVAINISSPVQPVIIRNNDSFYMSGNITYTYNMHGYELSVIDTVTGVILYSKAFHQHNNRFDFHEKWAMSLLDTVALKMRVSASIDHNGNVAKKEIMLMYYP